ncbi:MAG: glycosyltransferase [Cyclobacteriaceae bacterium]|nr:glycosyltransferase [Cyclobacteriaceae bacterium]
MRILFIAWDGPYVSYLDGLFLPIFARLKREGFEFSILHFTWAEASQVKNIQASCQKAGIRYQHHPIMTWPHSSIGKLLAMIMGPITIRKMVKRHSIDALMPRAMIPSRMVLAALRKLTGMKIILDADGLQIEERVDFAGLKRESMRFKFLKDIEQRIMYKADVILTRSHAAAEFLTQQYGEQLKAKMFKVVNGRDEKVFSRSSLSDQQALRVTLNIPDDAFVSVYCGSLGPQYGVDEMIWLHRRIQQRNPQAWWLVITGNPGYLANRQLPANVIIRRVRSDEVPKYLSIANLAFALRKNSDSMKGVAPVKLGEYLLMGLPVIASSAIGDTGKLLEGNPSCMLMNDLSEPALEGALSWLERLDPSAVAVEARRCGEEHFGLSVAVNSYLLALRTLG